MADKVLFFDMDGTLIDTNLANFLAYEKAIKAVTEIEVSLNYDPNERFNRTILKSTFPHLPKTKYEAIIQKKESYYEEFLHEVSLITENTNILLKYSETNKTVLVTNCRKNRALITLNHFGLTNKFYKIFYREINDYNKKTNKYQNALTILGIPSDTVIAFENEESEISDARDAGIRIINPKISV